MSFDEITDTEYVQTLISRLDSLGIQHDPEIYRWSREDLRAFCLEHGVDVMVV